MPSTATDPGHAYAATSHIPFTFYTNPSTYDHYLSLPPSYASLHSAPFPLLLSLHSGAESQLAPQTSYFALRHGAPKLILAYDRLCSGLAPQIDIPARNPSSGPDPSRDPVDPAAARLLADWDCTTLLTLLDELARDWRVDPARIYVTGFGMGARAAWELALRAPAQIAALLPIGGGGDALRASVMRDVPVWAWHGREDRLVDVAETEAMVAALREVGAGECWCTVLDGVGHDAAWTRAYGGVETWEWMLEHQGESVEAPSVEFVLPVLGDLGAQVRGKLSGGEAIGV
ncbi:Alpha/Beta hydrolase protein [Geopyxis carbonaria]|nr:Alpha/Beta hydrolase protein [Geopyxis carbonaria]